MYMGSGTAKKINPQFLIERVTVKTGGSASTFYATFSKNVEKDGYIPVAVSCPGFNQAAYHAYNVFFDGSRVDIGCAKSSQSGTISSLNVYIDVTYLKV